MANSICVLKLSPKVKNVINFANSVATAMASARGGGRTTPSEASESKRRDVSRELHESTKRSAVRALAS